MNSETRRGLQPAAKAAVLGFFLGLLAPVGVADSKLVPTTAAIDFGQVRPFAELERTIRFSNTSSEAVRVCGTGSDCVCLSGQVPELQVEPGASGIWHIRLETCDYIDEVRRSVWLTTEPGIRVSVPVRYRVVPEVFCEPDFASLGIFRGDGHTPVVANVGVHTIEDAGFEILAAEPDDPRLECTVTSSRVAAGEPGRVQVLLQQAVESGAFRPTVWVTTTSVEVPRIRLPIFATATADTVSEDQLIDFGQVSFGTVERQGFSIIHGTTSRIGRVSLRGNDDLSLLEVRRSPGETSIRFSAAGRVLGRIEGRMQVQILEGDVEVKAVIPIRGAVVEPRGDQTARGK